MGVERFKLGDLCFKITDGSHNPPKGIDYSEHLMLSSKNVFDDHIHLEKPRYLSEIDFSKENKRTDVSAGDVLLTIVGTVGRVAVVGKSLPKFTLQRSVAVLKPVPDKILSRFLMYCLQSMLEELLGEARGVAQKGIYFKSLRAMEINTPPIPEQKRIVAILDQAFAGIEQARTKTEQNLKNARELFESYLQQVFSQRGEGWRASKLKEITSKRGSGATPRGGRASYKSEGISLIRSMNVHDRRFKRKDLAFIDDQQADKLSNVVVENNDVLLNITGASVARCCLAPEEYLPARVNQHVSIIRADRAVISPAFLNFVLTSKYYKDQLLGIGEAGSTRQAITKIQIEEFEVSYPKNLEDQQNLLSSLYSLEEKTNDIQRIYRKKLLDLDELKKSILQKAFSGELTKTLEVDTNKGAVA